MNAAATARPAPVGQLDQIVAAGADVRPEDVAVLRTALAGLLTHRPEIQGASVYAIAHGESIVRLFTGRGGWVPTLIRAADRRDARAVLARLVAALNGARARP
jgi:hypothetical protein